MTASSPTALSACGFLEKGFDLFVEGLRDFESLRAVVGSEKAGHAVVGQMHAVRPLIDQQRYRSIRAGVMNVLCHFFHDERIADHQAHDAQAFCAPFLAEVLTMVKARELHEAGGAD